MQLHENKYPRKMMAIRLLKRQTFPCKRGKHGLHAITYVFTLTLIIFSLLLVSAVLVWCSSLFSARGD